MGICPSYYTTLIRHAPHQSERSHAMLLYLMAFHLLERAVPDDLCGVKCILRRMEPAAMTDMCTSWCRPTCNILTPISNPAIVVWNFIPPVHDRVAHGDGGVGRAQSERQESRAELLPEAARRSWHHSPSKLRVRSLATPFLFFFVRRRDQTSVSQSWLTTSTPLVSTYRHSRHRTTKLPSVTSHFRLVCPSFCGLDGALVIEQTPHPEYCISWQT